MIIALTGEKLAGKGTTAQYIIERQGGRIVRFSQVLVDILGRLHKDATRSELVHLGQGLRILYGDDILAQVVRDDILAQASGLWIIDGMRFLREYELLSKLPQFYLLNITADLPTRYVRTRQRIEKSDEATMSLEEFTQREQDSTEQEIPQLQKLASHTINNIGSLPELHNHIDQWLAQLP